MSSRALRRLQGPSEIIQVKLDDSDKSADEAELKPVSKEKRRRKPINAFELVRI